MTSAGIRYSNIDPAQDTSTESCSTGVRARPSRNQCDTGTSPLAIATKLARRASDARRSYRPGSGPTAGTRERGPRAPRGDGGGALAPAPAVARPRAGIPRRHEGREADEQRGVFDP